jgi:DNA helicase HerA-like ATPase
MVTAQSQLEGTRMTTNGLARLYSEDKRTDQGAACLQARQRLGHIVSVSGSQAVAALNASGHVLQGEDVKRIEIGMLVKVPTPRSSVIGIVSAMSSPLPSAPGEDKEIRLVELSLAGEIFTDEGSGAPTFRRGVSNSPALGDPVDYANREELACVYLHPDASTIEIGTLFQDAAVPARLLIDELFGKHFLVVGTTGSGKSCAVTTILQRVLVEHHHAHIVVLDIHNEYADAFGDKAELIHPSNLRLPFWLLNFRELCAALTSTDGHHDAEVQILSDAILAARRRTAGGRVGSSVEPTSIKKSMSKAETITVDTPTPFQLADLTAYLNDQLGKLERVQATLPYMRLKSRIEALAADPRYGFMFRSMTVEDTMGDVLGRIFRIPVHNKPITVIDLAAVPEEILNVVISLISRLAFDLALWSEGKLPMLLICEEAHRYAPASDSSTFMPTRDALARIAKEGRKYGLSLGLVTQRPSELNTTIISQCSTVIAMRLSTERDQEVMRANIHDGTLDLLDYLPLLGDREAIVLGQGVSMPMRVRFHDLGNIGVPNNRNHGFSQAWKNASIERSHLDKIVALWRATGRYSG